MVSRGSLHKSQGEVLKNPGVVPKHTYLLLIPRDDPRSFGNLDVSSLIPPMLRGGLDLQKDGVEMQLEDLGELKYNSGSRRCWHWSYGLQ